MRLMDDAGRVGFGEIAPLPWFGSETQEQAIDFCQRLPEQVLAETLLSIPSELPACQFGFESALRQFNQNDRFPYGSRGCSKAREEQPINQSDYSIPPYSYSALLPTGKAALEAWQTFWEAGLRTFKLKIGVAPMQLELNWLTQLVELLPQGVNLRLDANGGLTNTEADQWLAQCDRLGVEFLEQPLPPNQLARMLQLREQYQTPIALDESVATLQQLKVSYRQGWRGIFIVKPAIAGFPSQLTQFYQTHSLDLVFSSVFETAIGKEAVLRLAAEISSSSSPVFLTQPVQKRVGEAEASASNPDNSIPGGTGENRIPQRALGLGTQSWLVEDGLDSPDFDKVWQSL